MPDDYVTDTGWRYSVVSKPAATCANCGGHIFETNELLSMLEGKIVWSHLEDNKCDDPEPKHDPSFCFSGDCHCWCVNCKNHNERA